MKQTPNLDPIGLTDKILTAVESIDAGRKGFAMDGQEHEGRLSYEDGISTAMTAFQETEATGDPEIIALVEEVFLQQELRFCNEQDTNAHNSLTQALQDFGDAFLSLEAVEDAGYKIADKTYPHNQKCRYLGFPKDAFHQCCIAHRTRLQNVLRAPGINMTEKAVLQQRIVNMKTAQAAYLEKQNAILAT
jgi:hypothetical protein